MDLRSAQQRASWNPFSSLIALEPGADTRLLPEFHGVPVVEYPPAVYSTIFHELTHLWCARTTRLGWFLSRAAALAFAVWTADREKAVQMPDHVVRLLAAYTPILEGLALYAQLDYGFEEQDDPLPSPVALFAQITHLSLARGVPVGRLFRAVREEAIWIDRENGPGLLELLLLDSRRPEQFHYFAGYLYVKAVARNLGLKSPAFKNPAVCLPFIVRLLCDHPIIERAMTGGVSERQILGAVHATVTRLTVGEARGASRLISSSSQLREWFDHWDLHGQLSNGQFERPLLLPQELSGPLFDLADDPVLWPHFARLRACTAAHLIAWASGRLLELSGSGFQLESLQGPLSISWIPAEQRLDVYYREPTHPAWLQPLPGLPIWYDNEARVLEKLEERRGQLVTLALFFTVTHGTYGLSAWDDNGWLGCLPFAPIRVEGNTEFETMVMALQLSPEIRSAFAQHILVPTWHAESVQRAADLLMR